jgi:hypothetical protein
MEEQAAITYVWINTGFPNHPTQGYQGENPGL